MGAARAAVRGSGARSAAERCGGERRGEGEGAGPRPRPAGGHLRSPRPLPAQGTPRGAGPARPCGSRWAAGILPAALRGAARPPRLPPSHPLSRYRAVILTAAPPTHTHTRARGPPGPVNGRRGSRPRGRPQPMSGRDVVRGGAGPGRVGPGPRSRRSRGQSGREGNPPRRGGAGPGRASHPDGGTAAGAASCGTAALITACDDPRECRLGRHGRCR